MVRHDCGAMIWRTGGGLVSREYAIVRHSGAGRAKKDPPRGPPVAHHPPRILFSNAHRWVKRQLHVCTWFCLQHIAFLHTIMRRVNIRLRWSGTKYTGKKPTQVLRSSGRWLAKKLTATPSPDNPTLVVAQRRGSFRKSFDRARGSFSKAATVVANSGLGQVGVVESMHPARAICTESDPCILGGQPRLL